MKKAVAIIVILAVAAVAAWLWYRQCGGVSHGELKSAIERESRTTRAQLRDESAAINAKLDRIEAKVDRVEAKLDKLIEMATPKLPDGMEIAK